MSVNDIMKDAVLICSVCSATTSRTERDQKNVVDDFTLELMGC